MIGAAEQRSGEVRSVELRSEFKTELGWVCAQAYKPEDPLGVLAYFQEYAVSLGSLPEACARSHERLMVYPKACVSSRPDESEERYPLDEARRCAELFVYDSALVVVDHPTQRWCLPELKDDLDADRRYCARTIVVGGEAVNVDHVVGDLLQRFPLQKIGERHAEPSKQPHHRHPPAHEPGKL